MTILNVTLLCLASVYGLFVCFLIIAIVRPVRAKPVDGKAKQPSPGVTVLIPFRNEASNLEKLVTSLNNQRYNGPIEVILVNDGSTDNYSDVTEGLSSNHPLRVTDSIFSQEKKLSSKQQALELGIQSAAYDWIALTDADITLEPHWLSSLMDRTAQGAALVFGHTVNQTGDRVTLFNWFQAFQLETLFSVAYAFYRGGLTGSCMGNNLLVSKQAFIEIGGYAAIGYSITEDCNLLRAFRKKGFMVAATDPFSPACVTAPCPGFRDHFHQIMRWAKGGFGNNPVLACTGILLGIQNILFIIALMGILNGPVALIVFCNLLLTWLFVMITFKKIRSQQHALHFWPFYLLFLIESFVLVIAMLFRHPVIWKERRI
jgi:1,2-diacylglycerol 3-beta-glucosyltransferase